MMATHSARFSLLKVQASYHKAQCARTTISQYILLCASYQHCSFKRLLHIAYLFLCKRAENAYYKHCSD